MTAAEQVLLGLVSTVYNAKKDGKSIEKGIAFPICLSVNERICNYSPLASEEQVRGTAKTADPTPTSPMYMKTTHVNQDRALRFLTETGSL